MTAIQKRIGWIDIMKAVGIFAFYMAHMPGDTGRFNMFFMTFVIQLFAFAGGATASRKEDMPVKEHIIYRFRRIMVPYFLFGIVNILIRMVCFSPELGEIIGWGKQLLKGQRNNLFAVAMWFLPCMFCISVIYHILKKVIQNKWLVLAICAGLSLFVRFFYEEPRLYWSIDSAVRFLFYYALADTLAQPINQFSWGKLNTALKVCFSLFTAGMFGFLFLYYQFGRGYFPSLVGVTLPYYGQIAEMVVFAFVGVYCVLVISKLLAHVKPLQNIGKASMLLCCFEMPVKLLVPIAFETVGLTLLFNTPIQNLLCTVLFIAVGYYLFAKPVTCYFPAIVGQSRETKSPTEKT